MLARRIILILIPLLIFGGLGGWLWYDRSHPQQPAGAGEEIQPAGEMELPYDNTPDPDEEGGVEVAEQPGTPPPAPVESVDDLPGKDTPDRKALTEAEVLQAASDACKAPLWMQLLAFEKPLRTAVQVIDAIAHGERPLDALSSLRPKSPFTASPDAEGRLVLDAAALARFQMIAVLLENADARALASLYTQAEPLLQRECQAMGYQDIQIRTLLTDACSTILAIPDFDFEPTLVMRAPGLYTYEDDTFQRLNDAQKLFVRLGHINCRRLKQLCNDFADELQLYKE